MNDKQKYMSDYISRISNMQQIVSVRWLDWDDLHIQCGLEYTDVSGNVLVIPMHAPDNICSDYTECDFVLNNLMLKMAFVGNSAESVPDYPLDVNSVAMLVMGKMSADDLKKPEVYEGIKAHWKREHVSVRGKAPKYFTTDYQIRINPAYKPAYVKIVREWKRLDKPFTVLNTWGVPGKAFNQEVSLIRHFRVVMCLDDFDFTGELIQAMKEAADELITDYLLNGGNFVGQIVLA